MMTLRFSGNAKVTRALIVPRSVFPAADDEFRTRQLLSKYKQGNDIHENGKQENQSTTQICS